MTKRVFNIVALTGVSASGKTTVAEAQISAYSDSTRWRQATTREPRQAVEDYVFLERKIIEGLNKAGRITCFTEFNDNMYGTFIEQNVQDFVYVVVDANGLKSLFETKSQIENVTGCEVNIVTVNLEMEVTQEILDKRKRARPLEFVINERATLADAAEELSITWDIKVDTTDFPEFKDDPSIFRKMLLDVVKPVKPEPPTTVELYEQIQREGLSEEQRDSIALLLSETDTLETSKVADVEPITEIEDTGEDVSPIKEELEVEEVPVIEDLPEMAIDEDEDEKRRRELLAATAQKQKDQAQQVRKQEALLNDDSPSATEPSKPAVLSVGQTRGIFRQNFLDEAEYQLKGLSKLHQKNKAITAITSFCVSNGFLTQEEAATDEILQIDFNKVSSAKTLIEVTLKRQRLGIIELSQNACQII